MLQQEDSVIPLQVTKEKIFTKAPTIDLLPLSILYLLRSLKLCCQAAVIARGEGRSCGAAHTQDDTYDNIDRLGVGFAHRDCWEFLSIFFEYRRKSIEGDKYL